MVKTTENIKNIGIGEMEEFITDMQQMSEQEKVQILTDDEQMSNPEAVDAAEKHDDPMTSRDESGRNLKKKRRSMISEKGMRHISRLINMISEDNPALFLMGQAEGQKINIRFDRRGEFNVITSSAVEKIESNVKK